MKQHHFQRSENSGNGDLREGAPKPRQRAVIEEQTRKWTLLFEALNVETKTAAMGVQGNRKEPLRASGLAD